MLSSLLLVMCILVDFIIPSYQKATQTQVTKGNQRKRNGRGVSGDLIKSITTITSLYAKNLGRGL